MVRALTSVTMLTNPQPCTMWTLREIADKYLLELLLCQSDMQDAGLPEVLPQNFFLFSPFQETTGWFKRSALFCIFSQTSLTYFP